MVDRDLICLSVTNTGSGMVYFRRVVVTGKLPNAKTITSRKPVPITIGPGKTTQITIDEGDRDWPNAERSYLFIGYAWQNPLR